MMAVRVPSSLETVLPLHHFFFFNDTATTEIYTLSLHDALPIFGVGHQAPLVADLLADDARAADVVVDVAADLDLEVLPAAGDRKSTRLNSSHANISYAVFCLKKNKHTLARKRKVMLSLFRTTRW